MSTKEEVLAAARGMFHTIEKELVPGGAKITVRELSRAERDQLDERLFDHDETGSRILVDEDDQPSAKGKYVKMKAGVRVMEEWLAVTMEPAMTVEELLTIPDSVKRPVFDEARKLNGLTVQDASGN